MEKEIKNKKKNSKKSILLICLCFILFFIVGIGVIFINRLNLYQNCFVDNVFINNIDVSRKTIPETIADLCDISNQTIVLKDVAGETTLKLEDFVTIEIDKSLVVKIYNQVNTTTNKIFGIDNAKHYINKEIIVNKEQFLEKTKDFRNIHIRTKGTNAYIEYKDSNFEIIEENVGTLIDEDLLFEYIKKYILENCFKDINNEYIIDISNLDVYVKPTIVSSMLENDVLLYNNNLSYEFDMDFYGNIERIDKNILYSWITFDENNKPMLNENNGFIYDYEKVFKTMVSYANKYYTYGNEFKFLSHNGEYVTLESPQFGWSLKVDDTANVVMEQLNNKKQDLVYGVFLHKGIDDSQGGLINYVEVDIDEQHLYYYKNGELVLDSDFVSGNYGKTDTNKGVHRLMYKTKNATLRGRNYASFVYYWMPFNSDGEGFHDATWRSKFGGEIYKGDGSHGCVNMPLEKAKELYNLIENDTIVIVY